MIGSVSGFLGALHNTASEEKPIYEAHDCSVAIRLLVLSCRAVYSRGDRTIKQLTKGSQL